MSDSGSTLGLGDGGARRADQTLPIGAILADRYTILRFIGRGGMGEVYEASDALMQQHVALKVLRQASLRDAAAMERMRREVQLARQVAHPNVCRVYDIGCHQLPDDANPRPIFFLTMELLAGETLFEKIRRDGPFDAAGALPLIRQIADGLSAAHAQGIIHRDLKTSNVILVGDADSSSASARAVVTDFGLARLLDDDRGSHPTTGSAFAGTPEYMSPEQLQGTELTAASDVYSLGVVMYEMVTGTVPFSGASPIATAVKSVVERPPSPRLLAPELSERWEAVILRCLSQDPAARFASPADVVRALVEERWEPATQEPPVASPTWREKRPLVVTASAVTVIIMLVLGVSLYRDWVVRKRGGQRSSHTAQGTAGQAARPIVAFLGFRDVSGRSDTAWLSTALTEMLSAELAVSRDLRCLPAETAARLKSDLMLPDVDSLSPDTLSRVRNVSGANHVVIGHYFATGADPQAHLRVDVRVQNTATGETEGVVTREDDLSHLLSIVSEVGADLRGALGVPAPTPGRTREAASLLPATVEAARYYADGLDRLRRQDALGARETLQKAIAAEETYPLAHLALSDTWLALGYSGLAGDEAKKAYDLSGSLSSENRLSIEGRYRERTRDWEKAIAAYETLWQEFPDSLEDGLRLALAEVQSGREVDALKTIGQLRQLPHPMSDDPRIAMAEAVAAVSSGDVQRQYRASAHAVDAARASGGRLTLAEALMFQGDACAALNRSDEALKEYAAAKEIFVQAGSKPGEVAALIAIAGIREKMGSFEEAKRLYGDARKVFRAIGDRRGEAWALSRRAVSLRREDDLGGAEEAFGEALLIARDAQNDESVASILNNLAVVAWLRGDRDASKKRTEEAVQVTRRMRDKRGECRTLLNYAFMLMADGELATAARICNDASTAARESGESGVLAESLVREAECARLRGDVAAAEVVAGESLGLARARNARAVIASALYELGAIRRERNESSEARAAYQESLSVSRENGDGRGVLMTRLAIGILDLDTGNAEAAERAARATLSTAESAGRPDNPAAVAADLLARALLARDQLAAAEQAAQQAVGFLDRGAPLETRLATAVTMARVRARSGNVAQARNILAPARSDAERAGLRILEIEARLAEAQMDMAADRDDIGRALAKATAATAESLGLKRLSALAASIATDR